MNRLKFAQITKAVICTIAVITLLQACSKPFTGTTISIDAGKVENSITPYLYGACIEDVNHEIYGGLYDQKIFGESFEEPVQSPAFDGFTVYDGTWTSANSEIEVMPHAGAKLVFDNAEISTGEVEVEIKFDKMDGDNAGILFYVNNPRRGADSFYGYEVSLHANGKHIVAGKHKNNFQHINSYATNVNPLEWNRLKVVMDSGKFEILVNSTPIATFNDVDHQLTCGKVALRTWNSHAKYRNLKIKQDNSILTPAFKTKPSLQISSQWDAVQTGSAKAIYTLNDGDCFHGQNSQTLELVSGNGTVGISNASLNRWGIAIDKQQTFEGSLYLKSSQPKGDVHVALQSMDGAKEYARFTLPVTGLKWQKYDFHLTANEADDSARFVIYTDGLRKLWVDQVTLMTTGKKQFRGLPLRGDIGEMMVQQGLTFLRYGGTMINTEGYRFKNMIGHRDKRPPYTGHWYKYSTNGFGIEDFLQFCEKAGFVPAFAINIEEKPQDIAHMIEYLNGAPSSEWGSKRAANGHPQPYGVKYIGIGNEEVLFNGDRADEYDHYIHRFNLLYNAVQSKDTSVQLVCTAWWRPQSPNVERVFKALDGKAAYWDYHPWADQLTAGHEVSETLRQMKELFHKWNPNTTMKCAIFEENNNTHNIQRTLGHVTLQNAVRRMGTFVLTSCAANALQPYMQNDNGWDQGQIFFTPSQVWGMPPYYAQQMASAHHLPLLISSTVSNSNGSLDVTATQSINGKTIVLHIANTGAKAIDTNLQLNGFGRITSARAITLSGELTDVNTPAEPEKIIPVEEAIKPSSSQIYRIKSYSYTIIEYSKQD